MPRASSRSSARACASSRLSAREELVSRGRIVAQPRLEQAKRDRQRDEPLLCAVVQIALERAPGGVFGPHEPRARRAEILGDQLALGDVDGRDEEERPLVDLRERRARPRHRQPSPGLRHPVWSCSFGVSPAATPRRPLARHPGRPRPRTSPRRSARRSRPARTRGCARTRCSRRGRSARRRRRSGRGGSARCSRSHSETRARARSRPRAACAP